jgi:hypothetical protein
MMASRKLKVFLCHASQDKPAVREFYSRLSNLTWIDPWLDESRILPGQDWNLEIEKAVESSDAVIVFLSKNSVGKEGYIQRELRFALDVANEKPEGAIFIIPARLDSEVSSPRRLSSYQWVDLFEKDGYQKVIQALEIRGKAINIRERDTTQYDLDVVNDMLRELSDEQLRRLVYEEIPSLFNKINWRGYAFGKVSEIIFRAQDEDKVSAVVSWVSKNASKTYSKYSSRLPLKFSVKNVSAKNVSVKIDGGRISDNIINVNRGKVTRVFRNPYVVGNPIQPSNNRVFLGRLDIAESIVNEIKHSLQKPSFLLYGRRRMGKTSTLLNLSRLIRDIKIIDVIISGQDSQFRTDFDFCFYGTQKIIQTTKNSLLIQGNFNDQRIIRERAFFEDNPAKALSIFFDDYHEFLEKNNLYCLIMLDEYEEFGNLSRDLLMQLRNTMQHKPRIIFIFSGLSHMKDLANPYWAEVFVNVRTLKISFLQHPDGYKLLTEPAPELIYETDELIERILDLTGCQPFLLQAIAAELVSIFQLSSKVAVSNRDLDLAIEEIFRTWQNYFEGYVWQKECNSDIHKVIIKQVAKTKKVNISKFDACAIQVKDLIEKDLLKNHNGTLKLTMPIIELWLRHTNQI